VTGGLGMDLLEFLVIPVGFCLLVCALVLAPDLLRRPRYRPGRAWEYAPLWFGGPENPDAAVAAVPPGRTLAEGGASGEW
jgi:hypothetical protein